jgi:hypothetical protein
MHVYELLMFNELSGVVTPRCRYILGLDNAAKQERQLGREERELAQAYAALLKSNRGSATTMKQ